MPLRNIDISMPDEFGLTKKIEILDLHIYIGKQKIEVSYATVWSFNSIEVKREISNFVLFDHPDTIIPAEEGSPTAPETTVVGRKYLTEWDSLVGDTIEQGIRSYFS